MKSLSLLYRENRRYILLCLGLSLAFSVLAFGSGRFSFASSTEEVLAFGGSFGVLLATIVSSGFVEGLDRNWAMVILAGTSLGSMAGHKAGIKLFDFFDNYSFGLFENMYFSIIMLIWFGLPLLLKAFSKTNAIGITLENTLKKLDGVLLLLIAMSQVIANSAPADTALAAAPGMVVEPTAAIGIIGRGVEVIACFLALVLMLVIFFLTRYLFLLVDIILVPVATFIPCVSAAVVLGKLFAIIILVLSAVFVPIIFVILMAATVLIAALLFGVAYRACRYFGSIYAKPLIKKIFGGYDREKPLIDEKLPAKVKTFLGNSNVRMAIPVYLLKFRAGINYMHKWDHWWFVCTDSERFICKPLLWKKECHKIPVYHVPQQKMFINQFAAYYEMFNITGPEESLTKVFFRIPKQFHIVFSKEYFYRYQEIKNITGFIDLAEYKQYLKQMMPKKGGILKKMGF